MQTQIQMNNRAEKNYRFGTPKRNNHKTKTGDFDYNMQKNNGELIMRGCENLNHPQLREMQRYGTCNTDEKEILKSIKNDNAVVIRQDEDTQTVLVRFINRYYVLVADIKSRFIKTFLPDTNFDLLYYVQQLIDKENLRKLSFS
jgi:hypothetical protein